MSCDHEFTDWDAVDRFGERLAEGLQPSPESYRAENLLAQAGKQA
jgi:hypothetical protein